MAYRNIAVAGIALLIAPIAARAQEIANVVNVYMTLPIHYENGSATQPEALKSIVLEWRSVPQQDASAALVVPALSAALEGSVVLPANAERYQVDLICGSYVFDAYAVTDEGQNGETGWSAPFDTGIPCSTP